ncbi:hypothetical protein ASG47_04710 [Devosia sp. Leaf420]|nr:hypothetical protein ASG47_04710 [Devosia sp. Leaf420]
MRALAVWSLLQIFNALTPKDAGAEKIARDLAYGAEPRQKLDIYAPRNASRPLPVVFFIYGGSWMDGDRHNYDFAGRALAALGYVTVVADYRLLPEVEYPAFLDDCFMALKWVEATISEFGGDSSRIGLMGHSAGAYNAIMLALHPNYLAQSTITKSVRCVVGLSGPYDFFPFDGKITMRTFGAVPNPRDTQPIEHVRNTAAPMFLATGDKDGLVYPRNTVALAKRLRGVGVTVEEKHYPQLGHPQTLIAFSRPGRRMAPVLDDVAKFLDSNLKV